MADSTTQCSLSSLAAGTESASHLYKTSKIADGLRLILLNALHCCGRLIDAVTTLWEWGECQVNIF